MFGLYMLAIYLGVAIIAAGFVALLVVVALAVGLVTHPIRTLALVFHKLAALAAGLALIPALIVWFWYDHSKPDFVPCFWGSIGVIVASHKKNNQRRIAVMKKNIKLIPLFLFLFIFQLLYFLSTIYTEKIDHMFLILAVFMILICILLYCVLSDVLKKSNTEMELAFLQKQKQLKQEQDYSLQIRRQDTQDFQVKTAQGLQNFQSLLEQGKHEQADTAIKNLNQTFQKDRFHPYCQNNLNTSQLLDNIPFFPNPYG